MRGHLANLPFGAWFASGAPIRRFETPPGIEPGVIVGKWLVGSIRRAFSLLTYRASRPARAMSPGFGRNAVLQWPCGVLQWLKIESLAIGCNPGLLQTFAAPALPSGPDRNPCYTLEGLGRGLCGAPLNFPFLNPSPPG
jgi:hypothetical protein